MESPDNNQKYLDSKKKIDREIQKYTRKVTSQTKNDYGEYPLEAVKAYCEILSRGGKRLRGVLAMNSYYMFGGKEEGVAIKAALAIEMLQAYILMADDIQDRSDLRRGGLSAHKLLNKYHKEHILQGDSEHFGVSVAINALLYGAHSALNIIADMNVDAGIKIAAIKNINDNFIKTVHGQTLDIFNESVEKVTEKDVDRVMSLKTAHYTFLNPLQVGGILAGADQKELKVLEGYAQNAGRVFQIQDDINGIFGSQKSTGKSLFDDIREGKRTLLIVKALELAGENEIKFLKSILGNKDISREEFNRVKAVVQTSGALNYAQEQSKISLLNCHKQISKINKYYGQNSTVFLSEILIAF